MNSEDWWQTGSRKRFDGFWGQVMCLLALLLKKSYSEMGISKSNAHNLMAKEENSDFVFSLN